MIRMAMRDEDAFDVRRHEIFLGALGLEIQGSIKNIFPPLDAYIQTRNGPAILVWVPSPAPSLIK